MSNTAGVIIPDNNKSDNSFQYSSPALIWSSTIASNESVNHSDLNLHAMKNMISANKLSVSGDISVSSFASDDSIGDNILEENGRISLAYENLRTIPRRIAEKFAPHTKSLDLSYNHFQNLSFLSFFDELDTLILDRNYNLIANTLPFLLNLKILWINNCNICNLAEWISRIQTHCPSLEHLSIMGNPGASHNFSYNTEIPHATHGAVEFQQPTAAKVDYREYILNALPQLQYLDGVARSSKSPAQHVAIECGYSSSCGNSRTTSSCSSNKLLNGVDSQKTSPTLSFKDLFRLNKRRNHFMHQTSSTN